jgi:hypothetical protein
MAQPREAMTQNLAERLCGQVACRDDSRVARRLHHKQVVDGVDHLDEGTWRDDFCSCLPERGVVAWRRAVQGTAVQRAMLPCARDRGHRLRRAAERGDRGPDHDPRGSDGRAVMELDAVAPEHGPGGACPRPRHRADVRVGDGVPPAGGARRPGESAGRLAPPAPGTDPRPGQRLCPRRLRHLSAGRGLAVAGGPAQGCAARPWYAPGNSRNI